jgi:hypothetical protein
MAKTSTAREMRQESFLPESLEAAIRDRVREVIEMLLREEKGSGAGSAGDAGREEDRFTVSQASEAGVRWCRFRDQKESSGEIENRGP